MATKIPLKLRLVLISSTRWNQSHWCTVTWNQPTYYLTSTWSAISLMSDWLGLSLLQVLTPKHSIEWRQLLEPCVTLIQNTRKWVFLEPNHIYSFCWDARPCCSWVALVLAKIGLQCAELRRQDRPNLGKQVLPKLKRLMDLLEESMRPSPNSQTDSLASTASIQVNTQPLFPSHCIY